MMPDPHGEKITKIKNRIRCFVLNVNVTSTNSKLQILHYDSLA